NRFAQIHAGVGNVPVAVDNQYGWRTTMTIWAVLCFVLFLITFAPPHDRIQPVVAAKRSAGADFSDLLKNHPRRIMWGMTLVDSFILSFRGGALYNYYHHYAARQAMYDWVSSLHPGLTAPPLAPGEKATGFIDGVLGYVVHADKSNLASS